MSELTREQVEQILDKFELWLSKASGSDGVDTSDLLKHDAALRARLAEVEIELEECKHQNGISAREMSLEQQLAALRPTWSRERPTVAGWYWFKDGSAVVAVEVEIVTFDSYHVGWVWFAGWRQQVPLATVKGEWCPIPLPAEALRPDRPAGDSSPE